MADYIYAVFALIAGLGAFLLGVTLLSENTEKLATARIKNLFHKTSGNRLVGVGIGTVTTAIVQSSSLTTVMVVGFVNAGVMTLAQATSIIMGANIGTTITAQIAALQAFSFAKIAMALAGVGTLIAILSKREKVRAVSFAVAGLGMVFVGLEIMSDAMAVVKQSQAVVNLFSNISNPFLLFFIGIAVTAVVQSSSAVTSILISMASAGIMIGDGGNDVFFIVLGTNIGTCVTALLSSIGANTNARRASVIHLLFNVIGSVIFFILLLCWRDFAAITFEKWFPGLPSTQIAMFHTFFNVLCTLLFLPFVRGFVKLSEILVHEKKRRAETSEEEASLLEKRFLSTPPIAAEYATEETIKVLRLSVSALRTAVEGFIGKDEGPTEEVTRLNERIQRRTQDISDYLTQISAYDATLALERRITALHAAVGDVSRISDLAGNVTKYTRRSVKDDLHFSPAVKEEIGKMMDTVEALAADTVEVFAAADPAGLSAIDKAEDAIDAKRKALIKDHISRLASGECKAENSGVFINLVCNLERAGDHLTYIAHSVESF